MPIGLMLELMGSDEIADWIAWEHVAGPIGAQRIDFAAAAVSQTLAEIHRNRKKRPKPFSILDFLPFRLPWIDAGTTRRGHVSDPKSILAMFKGLAKVMSRQRRGASTSDRPGRSAGRTNA